MSTRLWRRPLRIDKNVGTRATAGHTRSTATVEISP